MVGSVHNFSTLIVTRVTGNGGDSDSSIKIGGWMNQVKLNGVG